MQAITIADYPALRLLAWNRHDALIAPEEALALYERNWRFVDRSSLTEPEARLIAELAREFGHGVLNV